MGKEKTPQAGAEEKPATDAQKRLIKQLMEELNVELLPEEYQGRELNRLEASNCIHLFKEMKVRDQQLRAANAKASNFDKIGFGMVYKLCWKQVQDMNPKTPSEFWDFKGWVFSEYKQFKDAQRYAKQRVEEGGQQ